MPTTQMHNSFYQSFQNSLNSICIDDASIQYTPPIPIQMKWPIGTLASYGN